MLIPGRSPGSHRFPSYFAALGSSGQAESLCIVQNPGRDHEQAGHNLTSSGRLNLLSGLTPNDSTQPPARVGVCFRRVPTSRFAFPGVSMAVCAKRVNAFVTHYSLQATCPLHGPFGLLPTIPLAELAQWFALPIDRPPPRMIVFKKVTHDLSWRAEASPGQAIIRRFRCSHPRTGRPPPTRRTGSSSRTSRRRGWLASRASSSRARSRPSSRTSTGSSIRGLGTLARGPGALRQPRCREAVQLPSARRRGS